MLLAALEHRTTYRSSTLLSFKICTSFVHIKELTTTPFSRLNRIKQTDMSQKKKPEVFALPRRSVSPENVARKCRRTVSPDSVAGKCLCAHTDICVCVFTLTHMSVCTHRHMRLRVHTDACVVCTHMHNHFSANLADRPRICSNHNPIPKNLGTFVRIPQKVVGRFFKDTYVRTYVRPSLAISKMLTVLKGGSNPMHLVQPPGGSNPIHIRAAARKKNT